MKRCVLPGGVSLLLGGLLGVSVAAGLPRAQAQTAPQDQFLMTLIQIMENKVNDLQRQVDDLKASQAAARQPLWSMPQMPFSAPQLNAKPQWKIVPLMK